MKKVLVAGATGYLGRFVVQEFMKQGFHVRALTRQEGKLDALHKSVDEEFIGEVTSADSLKGICNDMDIVFSSIGITKQKDGLSYMDVDYHGNINLLKEAKRADVSKFIYVSVFNSDKMRQLKAVQAKFLFEQDLKASGLDYTIVYPNGFFSDMLEFLEMAKKGRGYVFDSGEFNINPIHGSDLAEVCVRAALVDEKNIHVGGPDIMTHNEILKYAFESLGKKAKISRIPPCIRNWLLAASRLLTSVKTYGPLEFFMTVLSIDMIAPEYGRRHLVDYFKEHTG